MSQVNPDILIWARESAGLSVPEAARKLKLGSKKTSGEQILQDYESGKRAPTSKKLAEIANQYKRPITMFYLNKPPSRGETGEDFRETNNSQLEEFRGPVGALIRDVFVRQSIIKSALIDAEDDEIIDFVGQGGSFPSIDAAKSQISEFLSLDIDEFRKKRNAHDAFSYLRESVEKKRFYVLLIGDLGSHHSRIPADVFRGFALSDPICPFIVINHNDAKSAWSFTLLHELVHIWVDKSGISDNSTENKIEKYCNDVASQILVEDKEIDTLNSEIKSFDGNAFRAIQSFAAKFNVSGSMLAYRLFKRSHISQDAWASLSKEFKDLWIKEKEKDKNKSKTSSGNYYATQKHRAGSALIKIIKRSLYEGVLTETKAGKALGVQSGNVAELVDL